MKILHVIAQLPHGTGSGVYFRNCVHEFGALGYEQAALFAVQDGFEFDVAVPTVQYPVCFKSEKLPFPIAGMSDVMPYESTIYSSMSEEMLDLWLAAFQEQLERAREEFAPDVVFLHHLWVLTSRAIEVFPEAYKVAFCHNTDLRQARQHPQMAQRHLGNFDELDLVFSLSKEQVDDISKVFGIDSQKIVPMGGAVDQRVFFPARCKQEKADASDRCVRIVYAGKIERSKGIFELIPAFKRALVHEPNLYLSIVGTPNEENKEQLDELIAGCERIESMPKKSQRELADFLRTQDIFVMPSFYEGVALMAVESLACGLRVVASEIEALMALLGPRVNTSGVIEYVALPGLYDTDKPVEEDIPAFIERLSDALLVQARRVKAGEEIPVAIQKEIEAHTWAKLVARINDVVRTRGLEPPRGLPTRT